MNSYKFIVQKPDGSILYQAPYIDISITEEINKGIQGQLNVSYPDIKKYANALNVSPDEIFATQEMEWYLKINSVDVFGGIFTQRRLDGDNTGLNNYQVSLADFSALLDKRRTAQLFQNLSTDSGVIVENLLDYTNALNDTGIYMGLQPTTKNRDLTSEFGNIRDEIASMSNLKKKDGYDWEVDVIKALNLYYPTKGSSNLGIVFDEFNTLTFSSSRLLQGNLTNKAYVLGKGYGDDMAIASKENTASQTAWGLLEDVLPEKGVGTVTELEDRGEKFIDDNSVPSDVISISHLDGSPDLTTYNVGDTVKVKNQELDLDTSLRIYRRTIKITPEGQATIQLDFE